MLIAQSYQLECLNVMMASPLRAERCSDLVMLAHIQQLEELLLICSCKRIEEMLLKLLTWLAQRFGDRVPPQHPRLPLIEIVGGDRTSCQKSEHSLICQVLNAR